ncbi:MAG: DUF2029 domain-containing protein [Anaerolineae bacterium]|nr:DUF2029 domain-containing protein [Anaerolineae bacterium]
MKVIMFLPSTSPRFKQGVTIGLWLLVAVLVIRSIPFLKEAAVRPSHGFVVLYTAAQLVAEGEDSASFYDYDWFNNQITRFVPPHIKDINVNPPFLNLFLLPLVNLGYIQARTLWTGFSVLCLLGTIWLWLHELKLRYVWLPVIGVLVLTFQPVRANLWLGQVYIFLLALVSIVWWGYRRERDGIAGGVLGLLLILKLALMPLWGLFLVQRRWKILLWGTAVFLTLFLLSLPLLGWNAWERCLYLLLNPDPRLGPSVTAYQTIFSFFRHLFIYDPQWNLAPIFQAPVIGIGGAWMTFAVLLGIPLYLAYKLTTKDTPRASVKSSDLLVAVFIILSVILNPLALDYHYPLLLLPIVILASWAWYLPVPQHTRLLALLVLGAGVALIATDLPYNSPKVSAGWWALLAYPKLYGGLLLWGLACWGIYRSYEALP